MQARRYSFCFSIGFSILLVSSISRGAARAGAAGDDRDSDKGGGSAVAASRTSAATNSKAPVSVSNTEYVIGPEDVIAVNVWKENDISRSIPVRPDGKLSLPLVGEIQAQGLTPAALQSEIEQRLSAYIAHPQVTVMVLEVKSQRFNVVGEVLRPGAYDLAKPMTVLDGIALAGGFAEFAKANKTYVLRRGGAGSVSKIPFHYKSVLKGEDMNSNVALLPGDTIIVP